MEDTKEPLKVLAIDGGGIKGLYSAVVLQHLVTKLGVKQDGLGRRFGLIAGTSTGGILAAGLAAGNPPERLAELYRKNGSRIFSGTRMPTGKGAFAFAVWMLSHLKKPIHRNGELKDCLAEIFSDATMRSIFDENGVALCITAVNKLDHSARVFKTPHLGNNYRRDDDTTVVDVCLATSAAPLYLPLHRMTSGASAENVYVDGGLWMNNPTPLALLEALKMTEIDREILLLSIGGPLFPLGSNPAKVNLDQGLAGWRAGAGALELSMDAQAIAANNSCQQLAKELRKMGRRVSIVRAHQSHVSREQAEDVGLDNASAESLTLLTRLAEKDAVETFRWVQEGTEDGKVIREIFN